MPKEYTLDEIEKLARDLKAWAVRSDERLIERWLVRHGLSYSHFDLFSEKSDLFKEIYEAVKVKKEIELVEEGMKGRLNITMLKFYLTSRSKKDWSDSPTVQVAGNLQLGTFLDSLDGCSKHVLDITPLELDTKEENS